MFHRGALAVFAVLVGLTSCIATFDLSRDLESISHQKATSRLSRVKTCAYTRCEPTKTCVETPRGGVCVTASIEPEACGNAICEEGSTCIATPTGPKCVSIKPKQCACPKILKPVCCQGKDGDKKKHSNECFCECAGGMVVDMGKCERKKTCAYVRCPADKSRCVETAEGPVCMPAKPVSCKCSANVDPVCCVGKGGYRALFKNSCSCTCREGTVLAKGRCPGTTCDKIICRKGSKCVVEEKGPTCKKLIVPPTPPTITPTPPTIMPTPPTIMPTPPTITCANTLCSKGLTCVETKAGPTCTKPAPVPVPGPSCTAVYKPVCCLCAGGKRKTASNECQCRAQKGKVLGQGKCAPVAKPVCCLCAGGVRKTVCNARKCHAQKGKVVGQGKCRAAPATKKPVCCLCAGGVRKTVCNARKCHAQKGKVVGQGKCAATPVIKKPVCCLCAGGVRKTVCNAHKCEALKGKVVGQGKCAATPVTKKPVCCLCAGGVRKTVCNADKCQALKGKVVGQGKCAAAPVTKKPVCCLCAGGVRKTVCNAGKCEALKGKVVGQGKCSAGPRPPVRGCPKIYKPVCCECEGGKKKTSPNKCMCTAKKGKVVGQGKCAPGPLLPAPVPLPPAPVAPPISPKRPPFPTSVAPLCPKENKPVCCECPGGVRKTVCNACKCEKILMGTVASVGKCPPSH